MKRETGTPTEGDQESAGSADSPQEKPERRSEVRSMWRQIGQFSHIGLEFGIATAIGYFAGRWLDGKLDTAPTFAAILALCGTAAAAMDLYRLVRRIQRENQS